jgi:hypothetical protein
VTPLVADLDAVVVVFAVVRFVVRAPRLGGEVAGMTAARAIVVDGIFDRLSASAV